jgi:8-amino-7-oxononanoate synthase
VIAAAARATAINRRRGDVIRRHLAGIVAHFERGVRELGLPANRSLFPVRRLRLAADINAGLLHSELKRRDVRTVLLSRSGDGVAVTFVLTAKHQFTDIERGLQALGDALQDISSSHAIPMRRSAAR